MRFAGRIGQEESRQRFSEVGILQRCSHFRRDVGADLVIRSTDIVNDQRVVPSSRMRIGSRRGHKIARVSTNVDALIAWIVVRAGLVRLRRLCTPTDSQAPATIKTAISVTIL